MYEIITTSATFWSNLPRVPQDPARIGLWPVAKTFINQRVGLVTLDQLRPQAQDDLVQGNTTTAEINDAHLVVVVDLGTSAEPS